MSLSTETKSSNSDMVVSDRPSQENLAETSLQAAAAMSGAAAMMPMMLPYMGWNPFMQLSPEQMLAYTQMYGMLGYPYNMQSLLLSQQLQQMNNTAQAISQDTETRERSSSSANIKTETQGTFKEPRSISPPLKKALLQRYNGRVINNHFITVQIPG